MFGQPAATPASWLRRMDPPRRASLPVDGQRKLFETHRMYQSVAAAVRDLDKRSIWPAFISKHFLHLLLVARLRPLRNRPLLALHGLLLVICRTNPRANADRTTEPR